MDIVIIGTGNTASILGRKFRDAGHRILQVFGRDSMAASKLAYELGTESTNYWNIVNRDADLYVLAVNDVAIKDILHELHLPDKTIVHTAGSVSKNILSHSSSHFGVFYPLQSLRKEAPYLPDTPIIIDASDLSTLKTLDQLAHSISDTVINADDDKRLKLHLAAVFCNNFVNHLYTLAENYCKKENIDFNLLLPLIRETTERLEKASPSQLQTGPAIRNDQPTIQKHLELLKDDPEMKKIYEILTQSILRTT